VGSSLELPRRKDKALQPSQVYQKELRLRQHEGKREDQGVEHGQKLQTQILLGAAESWERIDKVWLLTVKHAQLCLAPDAGNELLVVPLLDEANVLIWQVALFKYVNCIVLI